MSSKIYIGGLPYTTTEQDLNKLFAPHGKVASARIITDKFTGQSRGFGFVEMSSDAEAQAAIEELYRRELGDGVKRELISNEINKTDAGTARKKVGRVRVSEETEKSQQQTKEKFRTALPSDKTVSMEVKVLEPVRQAGKELAAAHGMTAQQFVEQLLVDALNKNPKELEQGKKRLKEFKGSTAKARRFAEREELARLRQLSSFPNR